jgi:hypothetical protein
MYCQARAAYDRAYAVGDFTADEDAAPRDTKYADLGTLIHAATQSLAGCVFDKPPEDLSLEVRTSAAQLFGQDLARLDQAVLAAAQVAVATLPTAPDGKPWRAEVGARSKLLTGHIDFLSQDGTVLIDLKTTSRKPDHNRVKGEHYIQMLAYQLLVPTITSAHILYVDSLKARWSMLSPPIDFTSTSAQAQRDRIIPFLRRIRSAKIYATALAAPGGHCSGCFCPHVALCKDQLIPGPGVIIDRTPPAHIPSVTEVFP